MKVNFKSKKIGESNTYTAHDLQEGDVYRFGSYLVSELSSGCIIALDTDDNQIVTFDDSGDFDEWLDNNDHPNRGELTPLAFELNVVTKPNEDLF